MLETGLETTLKRYHGRLGGGGGGNGAVIEAAVSDAAAGLAPLHPRLAARLALLAARIAGLEAVPTLLELPDALIKLVLSSMRAADLAHAARSCSTLQALALSTEIHRSYKLRQTTETYNDSNRFCTLHRQSALGAVASPPMGGMRRISRGARRRMFLSAEDVRRREALPESLAGYTFVLESALDRDWTSPLVQASATGSSRIELNVYQAHILCRGCAGKSEISGPDGWCNL